jgi:hypothetical protein
MKLEKGDETMELCSNSFSRWMRETIGDKQGGKFRFNKEGKVKDIQGIQAYADRDFLIPDRRTLDFDIDHWQFFIKIRET